MGKEQDDILKGIQNQITNIQEKMRGLSENDNMSSEEKMNKRKEWQQQLQDLNKQLMQRQIEKQKEDREKKTKELQDQIAEQAPKHKNYSTEIGTSTMQSIINADSAMAKIKTSDSIKTKIEGAAGILESEIKSDEARGVDVTKKKEQLAGIGEQINSISSDIMGQLSQVNKKLNESDDEVENKEKTDKTKEGKEGTTEKADVLKGEQGTATSINETESEESEKINVEMGVSTIMQYVPIDIKL